MFNCLSTCRYKLPVTASWRNLAATTTSPSLLTSNSSAPSNPCWKPSVQPTLLHASATQ